METQDARRLIPLPVQPRVSVVTPTLNGGRFIRETLASVSAQDYPDLEHIVMDGGSTDATAEIVSEFPAARYLCEPDTGQSHAINKGFRLATGEIVAWLNADDYYHPGAVTQAVEALRADPACAMVYSGWAVVDEAGKELGRYEPPDWNLTQEIERGNFVPQQTTFFRRDALDAVGLLDERYHFAMDYDLFIRLGKQFAVKRVDGCWAAFRLHPGSKTVAQTSRFYREERQISRLNGAPFVSEHLVAHVHRRLGLPARLLPTTWQAVALLRRRDIGGLVRRAGRVARRARR